MADIEIPKRALFKAAEVCDLVKVQPYVLRSWEAEFPALGVSKAAGAPRTYRRQDVEQVVRIKHLLLVEGLTLAGARKRLEEEAAPVAADEPVLDELSGSQRARAAQCREARPAIDPRSVVGSADARFSTRAAPVRTGASDGTGGGSGQPREGSAWKSGGGKERRSTIGA